MSMIITICNEYTQIKGITDYFRNFYFIKLMLSSYLLYPNWFSKLNKYMYDYLPKIIENVHIFV